MSPKEPLPIFRPSRYLFPTLSSMVASCHCCQQKHTWWTPHHSKCLCCSFPQLNCNTKDQLHNLICLIFQWGWVKVYSELRQLLVRYVNHRRAGLSVRPVWERCLSRTSWLATAVWLPLIHDEDWEGKKGDGQTEINKIREGKGAKCKQTQAQTVRACRSSHQIMDYDYDERIKALGEI